MKNLFVLLLIAGSFLLSNCSGSKAIVESPKKGVQFADEATLSDVLEKAEKKGKLVFLDIYTDWCVPCKVMDEEVFSDQQVADFLNDKFISYKVDAEKGNGRNIAFLFQTQVYPTLLFLDHKGKVVVKNEGALSQSQLISMGNEALSAQRLTQ
ncbi:MAG: thioredoxin family protein [Bacteroidota bacterium]